MIGMFLITPENEVCFAQYDCHETIASFSLSSDRQCTVEVAAGAMHAFTESLTPEIGFALSKASEIIVAHISDEGSLLIEYSVPVKTLALISGS